MRGGSPRPEKGEIKNLSSEVVLQWKDYFSSIGHTVFHTSSLSCCAGDFFINKYETKNPYRVVPVKAHKFCLVRRRS